MSSLRDRQLIDLILQLDYFCSYQCTYSFYRRQQLGHIMSERVQSRIDWFFMYPKKSASIEPQNLFSLLPIRFSNIEIHRSSIDSISSWRRETTSQVYLVCVQFLSWPHRLYFIILVLFLLRSLFFLFRESIVIQVYC